MVYNDKVYWIVLLFQFSYCPPYKQITRPSVTVVPLVGGIYSWPHWHQVWPCDLLWSIQWGQRCMPVLSNSFNRPSHDFLSLPSPNNSKSQIGAIPSDWSPDWSDTIQSHRWSLLTWNNREKNLGCLKPLNFWGYCCCITEHKLADTQRGYYKVNADCYLPYVLHPQFILHPAARLISCMYSSDHVTFLYKNPKWSFIAYQINVRFPTLCKLPPFLVFKNTTSF